MRKLTRVLIQIGLVAAMGSACATTPNPTCPFTPDELETFTLEDKQFAHSPLTLTLPKSLGAYPATKTRVISVSAWRPESADQKIATVLREAAPPLPHSLPALKDKEHFSVIVHIDLRSAQSLASFRTQRARQFGPPTPFREVHGFDKSGTLVEVAQKPSGQIYGSAYMDLGLNAYFFTSAGIDRVAPRLTPEVIARYAAQLLILSQACNKP